MLINSSLIRKFLISITWISFFMSINLNPMEFENFNTIQKLRILSPFLLIILLIFLIKKIDYSALMKTDFLILNLIFLSYCFFNIYNTDNYYINIFWPAYMFLSLFFIVSILDQKEREYLIKLTILIIFFGFIFYFSLAVFQMYKSSNLNFYGIMGGSDGYMGFKNPPRSSGLARLSLILFSFFFLFLVLKKMSHNKNLLFFIIFLFSIMTILFQSRTASFIWLITFVSIYFFYINIIKDKLKILIFVFILPILVVSIYNNIKSNIIKNKNIGKIELNSLKKATIDTVFRKSQEDNFSSGRYQNWHKSYNIIKERPFIGYGAQADRIILNQSIHNAFLYSLLSGGLITGILFLLVYSRIIFFFVKFFFNKDLKSNFNLSYSFVLVLILSLRSLLETSFAVYSIDYLIFILIFSNLSNFFSIKINE
jgi:O-antigen ligase